MYLLSLLRARRAFVQTSVYTTTSPQKVHLLKVDTQGWELRVLRGAEDLLRRRAFSYVQYELSPTLMLKVRDRERNDIIFYGRCRDP